MASFKNASMTITTANQDQELFECSASIRSSIVHALYIANTGEETITVSVKFFDKSANNNNGLYRFIVKNALVYKTTTLVVDKVLNLEPQDKVFINASSTDCDITASVLEME
tara:strand:+ start:436 stop:771 length:336 start_codon:yes stop_codon:yes gene_type:complete